MAFRKIIKDSEGGQKYVTEQEEELVFDQVPTQGSFNPVTSDGVANALSVGEGGASIGEVVPPDTTAENPLVNEKALHELMLNTIGGRTYKTTKIGNKIWLAENLDYKFLGLDVGNTTRDATKPQANYYDNNEVIYGAGGLKYGLLYNFAAAKYLIDNQEAIIPGWRLPTYEEWETLIFTAGGNNTTGRKALKTTEGWPSYADGPGTNTTGFSAAPSGVLKNNNNFDYLGEQFQMFTQSWSVESFSLKVPFLDVSTASYEVWSSENTRQCSIRLVRDA